MKQNIVLVKKKFSEELKRCCLKKYKVIPSNAKLSNDFYLATKYKLKINQETFRLWMKGESFPDLSSLLFLIEWLEINLINIFDFKENFNLIDEKLNQRMNISSINNLTQADIDSIINILNLYKNNLIKK